jgi:hypothetical protein
MAVWTGFSGFPRYLDIICNGCLMCIQAVNCCPFGEACYGQSHRIGKAFQPVHTAITGIVCSLICPFSHPLFDIFQV